MIFITGASSGIGAACAEQFAAQKQSLVLIARRKERLDDLAKKLRELYGIEIHSFGLDLTSRQAVESFGKEQSILLERTTVLINNAGLAKGLDPIQTGNFDDWDAMIDTNLKGLLYVTRLILPTFVRKGSGHVVNLGSVAGQWLYPKGNIYCATKAAIRALTQTMRMDLLGTGVRVTEIVPGMVETEFSEVRLGDKSKAAAVYAGMDPLSAKDIAESIAWCVSRPPHVNIQELVIYPTSQAAPGMVHRR